MNLKSSRYLLEALIVKIALYAFLLMGLKRASNAAAKLSKFVGKKISVNKLAYKNISNALPHLSESEKDDVINGMWDNLGRIVGEFVHLSKTSIDEIDKFIEISEESKKHIEDLKKSGKGGIIFSAHIGNWEIGPKAFMKYGLNVSTVYRPLNNPYVEEMTAKMRGVDLIGKSTNGSRKIIETIKKGDFVIILADQKISEGEPVKFFHDYAITTTSIARIALKYDIGLLPARSIRLGKESRFRVEAEKPLAIVNSGDINYDVLNLTRQINCKLEEWITEYPSQWFWVHNRWKR